ncbi:hypothetical protein EDD11_008977 [Mortierella claussenii]|nr:hypothetical protein EDD11_008977 [Mortierella claussenii]
MLLLRSLLLVFSAAAAIAKGAPNAIVSGAIFVGEDTTNKDASSTDVFRDPRNHATAAASILVYSAESANYHPSEQDDPSSLLPGHSAFESKAQGFPGFTQTILSHTDIHLNGSFTQLEKEIRDNYASSDAPLVARSLRDLIPGVVVDKSLEEWLLSLVVIRKPVSSDAVTVKIVQVLLNISSDETHTAYIPVHTAKLSNIELNVIPTVLATNAERFAKAIHTVKVPGFIDYFSSPKVNNEILDGFERDPNPCLQHTTNVVSTHRQYQYRIFQWIMRD